MLAIVMVIVSIALLGALMYGGAASLQANSPARAQMKESTIASFYALATAYQSYTNANGSDLTAGSCSSTELVPTYLSSIKYPAAGLSCSFGTDGSNQCSGASCGDYFCYYGSLAQVAYNGAADAAASFPNNSSTSSNYPTISSYNISTSACGTHGANSTAPSTWPATIYLTYWLGGQ